MKHSILFILLLFLSIYVSGQQSIGIGTTSPQSSAILDITSTTKGVLIPRMTSGERGAIPSPATGLLVYDTNTQSFWYRSSTGWINLQTSRMLSDADGDTKIQVEELPDEDVIRMDVGGAESLVIRRNANADVLIEPGGLEENIFIGQGSGFSNTALYNTAVGDSTLHSNSSGTRNTANGYKSLYSNTFGDYNTATGYYSLFANSDGLHNCAFGSQALYANIDGDDNTAMGYLSLVTNTTGSRNTANGYQSLFNNMDGDRNTGIGYQSLYSNAGGSSNTAIGFRTLYNNTESSNLVAIGDSALFKNTSGSFNTA